MVNLNTDESFAPMVILNTATTVMDLETNREKALLLYLPLFFKVIHYVALNKC